MLNILGKKFFKIIPIVSAGFLFLFLVLNIGLVNAAAAPKLIKLAADPSIYYVSERLQAKKLILTSDAFFSYPENKWSAVQIVSREILNGYPDIRLIKTENGPAVFYISGRIKRPIVSGEVFRANNFRWSDILTVSEIDLNSYETGEPIRGVMTDYNVATTDDSSALSGRLTISLTDRLTSNAPLPTGVWNRMADLELANGGQAAILMSGLNLTATGLFLPADIEGVYLFDERATILAGGVKKSNSAVFSFRFAEGELVIPAGGRKTLKIYVAANRPGTVLGISVSDTSAIAANAEINGSFPLASYNHQVIDGSYLYGQITAEAVDALGGNKNVNIGAENQILTKFKLTETTNRRDILLQKMILTENGSLADGDLINVDLVTDNGVTLATAAAVENGQIIFDLSARPFLIGRGRTAILTVRGDIVGGENRNVILVIKKMTDLVLRDKDDDFILFALGQYPIGESQAITINQVIIDSGSAGVSFSNSDKDRDIIVGRNLVNLGRIVVRSHGLNLNVYGFELKTERLGSHPLVGNLILKSGQTELARYPAANFDNQYGWIDLTREIEVLSRGQVKIDVLADIDVRADNNDAYRMTVKNFNGRTHGGREIGADWQASGPLNRVKIAKIGVYKNIDQTDDFWGVAGMTKELLANFAVQIGAPENMVMTGITVKSNFDAITYGHGFEKVYIKVNNQVAQTLIAPTADPLVFVFPKNVKLSKGRRYELKFYADTAKSADGKKIQIQITNIDLIGATSGAKPVVEGLGEAGQIVSLKISKLTVAPVALTLVNLPAGGKNQVIGEFILKNESAEKMTIKELYFYSAIGHDELTYDAGFRNLRLVYLNGQRWSGLGGALSKPVIGGNRLGGFYLNAGAELRIRIVVDSVSAARGKNISLILQDVLAFGQHSKAEAEVFGDQAGLGTVSFGVTAQ